MYFSSFSCFFTSFKNMLLLLADSGSTKTEWALADTSAPATPLPARFLTSGLNPCLMSDADISSILTSEVVPQLQGHDIHGLRFYGAGCRPDQIPRMKHLLGAALGISSVDVWSDLLGAAHALCRHSSGIVAILGTGSGSALYDGQTFVDQTPSLGYVLGDEGSGAVLGRELLSDVFKQQLPQHILAAFHAEYGLSVGEVIEQVYRLPAPNRYLAHFAHFLSRHREDAAIREFLIRHFRLFFSRNVKNYGQPALPVHFVGSIAAVFEEEVRASAVLEGFSVGTILRTPLDGLIDFYRTSQGQPRGVTR